MEIEEQKRQLKTSQSELGRVKQELNDVQLSREVDNLKALHMIERNEVLEQTRLSLESSISDSKEQLAQRTQELEQLEETNRALSEKLETLQNQLSIVGEGGSFSLDRSLGNTEELLRLIDELKSEKEAAVKDKDTFEQGLLEAKQENERLVACIFVV
jgi:archaellum component FlaC